MSADVVERLKARTGNLWDRAITHPSFGSEHNQRLEFLGNGVLNLALADLMYHRSEEREGPLTKMCNYLRSDEVLNEVGRGIGIDAMIRFVPNKDGKVVDSVVAGCMEAVIGAIYENEGYDAASKYIEELFFTEALLQRARNGHDPITEFKELVEKNHWMPRHIEFDEPIAERRIFYHSIELGGRIAMGMGSSKKKAEEHATRCMLFFID